MFPSLIIRLRDAWAVLTGRIILPTTIEGISFMTVLAKTAVAIAALSASASRVIAASQANAEAAASVDQADSDTAAAIDAVTATLDAAAPVVVEGDQVQVTEEALVAESGDLQDQSVQ